MSHKSIFELPNQQMKLIGIKVDFLPFVQHY